MCNVMVKLYLTFDLVVVMETKRSRKLILGRDIGWELQVCNIML